MCFNKDELDFIKAISKEIFDAFYEYLTKDIYLRKFFNSQEQIELLVKKQQINILEAALDEKEGLKERFLALGKSHFDYGIPIWEVIKGFDFLQNMFISKSADLNRFELILKLLEFFNYIKQNFCRGYFENECKELTIEYQRELYNNAYHLVHSKWVIKMMEFFISSTKNKIPLQDYENRVFSQLLELPETNLLFKNSNDLDELIMLNAYLTSYAKNILHHVRKEQYFEAFQILQVFKNKSSNLIHLIDKTVVNRFKSKEESFFGYVTSKLNLEIKTSYICIINIKKLSLINKYHGMDTGDYVINEISERIKGFIVGLDENVIYSQASSGEFYLFFPFDDDEYFKKIINALVSYISNEKIVFKDYEFYPSLHCAAIKINNKTYIDYVYKLTHFVLSKAKDLKLPIYIASENELTSAIQLIKKSNENILFIQRAILKDGLELFFQPIIDIKTGKIFDVEVLVRIKSDNSYISAGEFINLIHELDIIIDMDMKVLDKIVSYQELLFSVVSHVFINISPSSLKSAKYVEKLISTVSNLKKTGLDVYLELTEQSFLENIELIIQINQECGVRFAVDDFGTGYSSLKSVAELAEKKIIDFIKIDGSIVRNALHSQEVYQILDATVYMTKKLNLKNIAEFVENKEILELLKKVGVDYAQGFYFSKPMHIDDLILKYKK